MTILRVLRETDSDPKALDQHAVKAALEKYQQLLDTHRYLDYDEMLLRAVVELESSGELRETIRKRVKYLTVDEYQDVNPIQEFLIRQIHDLGANLCVVGDDDQNIYQWRGSEVRHIVDFRKRYPDVAQVPLSINFRSSSAVVSAKTLTAVKDAGQKLRANKLDRLAQWRQNCVVCDVAGICRSRSAASR